MITRSKSSRNLQLTSVGGHADESDTPAAVLGRPAVKWRRKQDLATNCHMEETNDNRQMKRARVQTIQRFGDLFFKNAYFISQ